MSEPQVHIVAKHQCDNEAKEISLFSFHAVLWETTRFEEKKKQKIKREKSFCPSSSRSPLTKQGLIECVRFYLSTWVWVRAALKRVVEGFDPAAQPLLCPRISVPVRAELFFCVSPYTHSPRSSALSPRGSLPVMTKWKIFLSNL